MIFFCNVLHSCTLCFCCVWTVQNFLYVKFVYQEGSCFSIMLRLFHNRNLLGFFLRKLFWYSIVCPLVFYSMSLLNTLSFDALFSIILYILVWCLTLHIPFTLFVGPFNMLTTMIPTILD